MVENKQLVFIVDDDSSVRTSLSRLLGSAGYATELFSSATEYLKRPAYDGMACLILDVMMPVISGPQLYQRLIEEGYDLPTIFVTGHSDLVTGVEAMEPGVVDFLQKPIDELILFDAVSRAMARFQSAPDDRNIK